ncbi:hypothetical protein HK104_007902 [Borealophlyctis nickersoniae]|nr:hypothetical protein HK104_007902 [Borealophlyctis nickersoniae]
MVKPGRAKKAAASAPSVEAVHTTASSNNSVTDEAVVQNDDARSTRDEQFTRGGGKTMPLEAQVVEVEPKDMEMGIMSKGKAVSATTLVEKVDAKKPPKKKEKLSNSRCRWLTLTWLTTWWMPGIFLKWCGGMKDGNRRMAWREKFTLCVIIVLMNAMILFVIIGIGYIICPKKPQLSPGEISSRNTVDSKALVYMYGNYYSMPVDKIKGHEISEYTPTGKGGVSFWQNTVLGKDVSQMFRKDTDNVFNTYCNGGGGNVVRRAFAKPPAFDLFPIQADAFKVPNPIWQNHGPPVSNDDFLQKVKQYKKGDVVWDKGTIADYAKTYQVIVAYDSVYDVTAFYEGAYGQSGANFLGTYTKEKVFNPYRLTNGNDATSAFEDLRKNRPQEWQDVMTCMQGMFYVGRIDHRNDLECQIANHILLVASCILVSVIGFKFLAALQFTIKKQPEEHDKFVICQVPCYTEGETSLLRTLESLAQLDYDDKHKLLFVICDGMIIGSGNDRPTPRIVLDILGVDPSVDPESLAFQSLGDGNMQLNMGKVYSGLYEIQGRVVPFIVVVKVGKPSERGKPGNRGKRDSQLVLMRFLSRVHFNQPMCPLELEIYHQMKNVIGVDPSFYEYILMVDADTEVLPDSLNRLVSHMTRDSKIAGICGETQVSNEKDSWVSMIQVYEYFISHHLAKAFESLFGSVTCLPGCFCMYRVRTPVKNVPLLVAPGVIKDYAENKVDTLHMKNLLHLGEDRYLTTLMMKHFPNMKTTFTADAKALTNAPDKWSVLLSQRRRWINSTVHNLFELLFLSEMCGFCCFSMRFVVFIDLFATFVQPAALGYIIYLVYTLVTGATTQFPLISIIMLGAVYGFQIIIFLLKREWQHIGWMIIYMLAIPIFGCYIPMYSFWHFDDFSWGNTRMITDDEENVKAAKVKEEEFDPASVPLVKWADFEEERLEKDRLEESGSVYSYQSKGGAAPGYAASAYGGSAYGGTAYGGSVYGAGYPPPPASSYGGSHYGPTTPGYGAPPSAYGGDYGAYNPDQHRMSWGTQYTGADYGAYNPDQQRMSYADMMPQGVGGHQATHRPASIRSGYSASTDSPPRALPSDEEILREIRTILATADLMTVTKKSVRDDLRRKFGVDLSIKKEYIHRCIDGVLKGEI